MSAHKHPEVPALEVTKEIPEDALQIASFLILNLPAIYLVTSLSFLKETKCSIVKMKPFGLNLMQIYSA
jgi:hypothetical protein